MFDVTKIESFVHFVSREIGAKLPTAHFVTSPYKCYIVFFTRGNPVLTIYVRCDRFLSEDRDRVRGILLLETFQERKKERNRENAFIYDINPSTYRKIIFFLLCNGLHRLS